MLNAAGTTRSRSRAERTRKLCFVTGSESPNVSTSWNASVPSSARGTCPVIATSGIESSFASAIAVIRFVAPGPDDAMQTPGRPVARAMPCAMKPAPCS